MTKLSVVIPTYEMDGVGVQFLERCLESLAQQTYKDFEVVISDNSDDDGIWNLCKTFWDELTISYFRNPDKGMAVNTNHGINVAKGELIKILYQDDYLYDKNSLRDIIRHFTPTYNWLATACIHSMGVGSLVNPHLPFYSQSVNTIGSPSVITFRSGVAERFNPEFTWVLDLDFYQRLFKRYGKPKIMNNINVVIGIGDHQTTNKLSDEYKLLEHELLNKKL